MSFANLFESEIDILQVMEPAYSPDVEDDLQMVQQTIPRVCNRETRLDFATVYSENIVTAIHDYARQHDVDMLALCHTHRNVFSRLFHRSVKELNSILDIPLFLFPR
jgi:K+-sensing histidine kinase KdpD